VYVKVCIEILTDGTTLVATFTCHTHSHWRNYIQVLKCTKFIFFGWAHNDPTRDHIWRLLCGEEEKRREGTGKRKWEGKRKRSTPYFKTWINLWNTALYRFVLTHFRRMLLRYLHHTARAVRLSSVCCLSVTLHRTHRVQLFVNISAPSNSPGTQTVCIKILEKKFVRVL